MDLKQCAKEIADQFGLDLATMLAIETALEDADACAYKDGFKDGYQTGRIGLMNDLFGSTAE